MTVGIITYHFPYNCGAALQCLALQTKLEELGHEVCIINYRPWYHQNHYTALKNPIHFAKTQFRAPAGNFLKRIYHTLWGVYFAVRSWLDYPNVCGREKKCRGFVKRFLKETKKVYRTVKQLQKDPPACDIYIAGSDQLWNTEITEDKFDSAYFLNFGGRNVGRMTYSVGANFSKLADPEAALKDLIRNLDVISLRESQYMPAVEAAAGNIPTHIDLDPTMLLEPEKYDPFMPNLPEEKEPYILTYTMTGEAQKQIYSGARILSEKLGMKVIDVSADPNMMNKKVEDNRLVSADEFLWYVKHADYVFTNSFHGTVFSVLFRKKFVTIPHAQTGNRVTELLDKLGLSDRYHTEAAEAVSLLTRDIDYDAVFEKLKVLRSSSVDFLQTSVQKYGNKGD